MQKTKGLVTCRVRLRNIKQSKIVDFLSSISPTLRHKNHSVTPGINHLNTLEFDVEYGPVAGGWESDVRKKLQTAARNAGTAAEIEFINYRRQPLPR
jgi:hypothetical protein